MNAHVHIKVSIYHTEHICFGFEEPFLKHNILKFVQFISEWFHNKIHNTNKANEF